MSARLGEALTVHGDGTHRRCFTDVRDVVEGFTRLAACEDAHGQIVNIGSRIERDLLQLAGLVKSVVHSDSPVERIPHEHLPFGEYQRHIPWKTPCLSKARKLIGYAAAHPIEECLHEIASLDAPDTPHAG